MSAIQICRLCHDWPAFPGLTTCRACITLCTRCGQSPAFPACPLCAGALMSEDPEEQATGQTRCRPCQPRYPCQHPRGGERDNALLLDLRTE
jgi:hypothetical protein